MKYDTFKQYMKQLALEYENAEGLDTFSEWLSDLPELEKKEEKRWKPAIEEKYYRPCFFNGTLVIESLWWDYR